MQELKRLKYLAFEINNDCQLTKIHQACPRNANRWVHLNRDRVLEVKDIADFANYCIDLGFDGLINVHYYNEPLCTREKLIDIMDAVPRGKFSLWTNGILLTKDDEKFLRKFADVMVTIYPQTPLDEIADVLLKCKNVRTQPAVLDARIIENLPYISPKVHRCNRIYWEVIFDYHGHGHICCGDWKAEEWFGNILTMPAAEVLGNWATKAEILHQKLSNIPENWRVLPRICQICVTRTPGISQV